MSKYNFVHLHNHTEYSLLDGMVKIKDMVNKAVNLGMNAISITDHGNMYGVIEFIQACEENKIKPIIGSEFYMTPFSRFEKSGPRHHLILLAKSKKGYKNLLQLSSRSFTEGFHYKPRIDRDLLEKYSEELICLSACLQGEIPSLIIEGKSDEAELRANYFKELFGKDSFFLELQIHGIKEERIVAKELYNISKKLKIPVVATNDIHYLNKDDIEAHEVLLCIGTKKRINDPKRMRFNGEGYYFKSEEEMASIFREIPKALTNTQVIAQMCDLSIKLPGPQLPEFDVPVGSTKIEFLKSISEEGLKNRYEVVTQELKDRLENEIDVIERMGFPGYFLIVWDFIEFAKEHNIWVGPGRGSGAGSIVAYSLGITNIDPIKYGLIFERFLNEERKNMPDFDIDFCKERRQEVIDYVIEKYSKEKVCQIVTFSKMNARGVIRDVARVLDIPLSRVDEIVKLVPFGSKDLKKDITDIYELNEIYKKSKEEEKKLLDISIKLEGISRHTSLHAAGVVIGQKAITEYVPLQIVRDDKNGNLITTQFPGPQLEACGLVKMDFLGLITLTLLRNCVELLEKKGVVIDLDKIDMEDSNVYDLFARGNTEAIFQFESHGMRKFLKKLQPNCLEDLIAMNALYRPGPMNFIDSYIARKHGREDIEYDHPLMEPILKETNGIMIYQEQVMKIAQVLAGYDLGSADILRRAMGKKKAQEMKKNKKIFIEGCIKNDIDPETAEKIFNKMEEFANYGFNKSHAAAYAYLAYQCAHLKTYYPADFMASVLTSEINKPDKLVEYITNIKHMGIKILPPDIAFSDIFFTVEDGNIRYALNGIKGVGESASKNIIQTRKKEKKFNDLFHFLKSIDLRVVNRGVIETLIKSGALDSLGHKRKWMVDNLDDAISEAQCVQADKRQGQEGLFGDTFECTEHVFNITDHTNIKEWSDNELLINEKEALGFYNSGHPLVPYSLFIKQNCTQTSRTLKKINFNLNNIYSSKVPVVMAGIIDHIKIFKDESGLGWAIVNIEDFDGKFMAYIYKQQFEKNHQYLEKDRKIFIIGDCTINKKEEKIVVVKSIEDLDLVQKQNLSEFHVFLEGNETDSESLELFKNDLNDVKGELSVFFHLNDNGKETVIKAMNIKAPKDDTLCKDFREKYKFIKSIKIV